MGSFWLKCPPSIADWSLKVANVSPHRNRSTFGQNRPKFAKTCYMSYAKFALFGTTPGGEFSESSSVLVTFPVPSVSMKVKFIYLQYGRDPSKYIYVSSSKPETWESKGLKNELLLFYRWFFYKMESPQLYAIAFGLCLICSVYPLHSRVRQLR